MLSRLMLELIGFYQRWISRWFGDCCRFEPSCSRYAAHCIRHFGARRGGWLSARRLLRCNPFCAGDVEVDWARIARRIGASSAGHPRRFLGVLEDLRWR
jgi:uncharacterized protein